MTLRPLAIARTTFTESLRQPVLFVLVLLSGILQVFNTWNTGFSMAQEESSEVAGDTKLLFDFGLATVFVCGTLLAGFLATAAISREVENRTVLTLVSKPVSRVTLILGKYLGVTGAILLGTVTMLLFLLLAVRHGVMSTAADELDGPVLAFALGGVALTLLIGAWCNFFYGWSFPQTVAVVLLPMMAFAYLMVLLFNKKWEVQSLAIDFKPQVTLACGCLILAILVLSAIATAASARLSQVMTIIVCVGAFVAALLSNHVIGRGVFVNAPVGAIAEATVVDNERPTFLRTGDSYDVKLDQAPNVGVKAGDSFYFGPSPNGFPMAVRNFPPYQGSLDDANALLGIDAPQRVIVTRVDGLKLRVRHTGPIDTPENNGFVDRAPEPGDYVFREPTSTNYGRLALWGVVPNMHFFWLLDAVSQNRSVPPAYVGMAALYAAAQITAFLSLAVILFQRRDVG